VITFDIIGQPAPQGSKKAFLNRRTGKPGMKESAGAGLVAWRDAVSRRAREIAEEHGCLDGPLQLIVVFRFPMPSSRTKAERLAGCCWRTSTPDSSKVLRSLEDGLVDAGLIADDKLIVEHLVRKVEVFQSWSGATVTIGRVNRLPAISMPLPDELELFGEPA
jgi:Holliday junction resolvase RusA-like endonuclease